MKSNTEGRDLVYEVRSAVILLSDMLENGFLDGIAGEAKNGAQMIFTTILDRLEMLDAEIEAKGKAARRGTDKT